MSANAQRGASDSTGSGRARPALHFAPARNWMNDPNGLIEWGGRFHLFYQYNPTGIAHENIHWGHASSADLWSWTDHPIALSPQPDGPDRDGCWSGAAIVHEGVPHLVYTGMRSRAGEIETELPCVAVAADDELVSWVRAPENPVIAHPPASLSTTAFRDHSLWRHGNVWRQAIGAGTQDRGGAVLLYESSDLKAWSYVGVLCAARDHGLRGAIWECPDVFWSGEKAVVIVSVVEDGSPQHAMWMTGTMSEQHFVPEQVGPCDIGDRYYAPQSCTVGDGRRIAFGWLREAPHELPKEDRTRVGVMSLPRELTVAEDGTLESRPATELVNARSELLGRRVITDCDVIPVQLDARRPDAVEVVLAAGAGTRAVTVTLRGDGVDDVIIELGPEASTVREGQVTLAPADPVPPAVQEPAGLQAGPLHIFYDQGVLEVFGDRRCSPAAVICDRHGRYASMQVDVTAGPGAEPSLIEVWRCGAPPTDGYRGEPADTAEGVAFGLSSTQNELGLDG